MATASGSTFLAMSGGEISELLVRLAGLDVARSLGVLIRGDKPIPVRCALLNLQGQNGQMGVQTLVFDTASSAVSGEGTSISETRRSTLWYCRCQKISVH